MRDLGLLALRLINGGMLAGHGLQKLAGAFDGPGLQGTAGMMESLGLKPGRYWGTAAALSETSGILTALGLFSPLGSIGTMSAMAMAGMTVHANKPIWAHQGGAELPLINFSTALALMLTGPGKLSLDSLLGTRLPRPLVALTLLGAAGSVAYGISTHRAHLEAQQDGQDEAAPTGDPAPAAE